MEIENAGQGQGGVKFDYKGTKDVQYTTHEQQLTSTKDELWFPNIVVVLKTT